MIDIYDLPDELLLQILSYISPQDLVNFAVTSTRLRKISHARLQEHRSLMARYRQVTFNAQAECHLFTLLTLRTDIGFMSRNISERDSHLYHLAMKSSLYIENSDIGEWMRELEIGVEDPVMAILLPLLANLHTLHVGSGCWGRSMELLGVFIKRVVSNMLNADIPFSKLHTVHFGMFNGEQGFELKDIAVVMALPSVRIVNASCVLAYDSMFDNDGDFQRDEQLPLSKVDQCTFVYSTFSIKSLESFLAGIEGQCIISGEDDHAGTLYKLLIRRGASESSTADQSRELNLYDFLE